MPHPTLSPPFMQPGMPAGIALRPITTTGCRRWMDDEKPRTSPCTLSTSAFALLLCLSHGCMQCRIMICRYMYIYIYECVKFLYHTHTVCTHMRRQTVNSDTLYEVLSTPPVLADTTTYTASMSVSDHLRLNESIVHLFVCMCLE